MNAQPNPPSYTGEPEPQWNAHNITLSDAMHKDTQAGFPPEICLGYGIFKNQQIPHEI
jgi:hypothetical protein